MPHSLSFAFHSDQCLGFHNGRLTLGTLPRHAKKYVRFLFFLKKLKLSKPCLIKLPKHYFFHYLLLNSITQSHQVYRDFLGSRLSNFQSLYVENYQNTARHICTSVHNKININVFLIVFYQIMVTNLNYFYISKNIL